VKLILASSIAFLLLVAAFAVRCNRAPPVVRIILPSALEGDVVLRHEAAQNGSVEWVAQQNAYVISISQESMSANLSLLDQWHVLEVQDDSGQRFFVTSAYKGPLTPFHFDTISRDASGHLRVRIRRN
jgi:hypothetical protein